MAFTGVKFGGYTVTELRELAKLRGIKNRNKMKGPELLAAIEATDNAPVCTHLDHVTGCTCTRIDREGFVVRVATGERVLPVRGQMARDVVTGQDVVIADVNGADRYSYTDARGQVRTAHAGRFLLRWQGTHLGGLAPLRGAA